MNTLNNYPQKEITSKHHFLARNWLVLLAVFLSSMEFYSYGAHIMVLAFMLYIISVGRISVSAGIVPILALSCSILVFCQGSLNGPSAIANWLQFPSAFIVGYGLLAQARLIRGDDHEFEKRLDFCVFVIALGYFCHIMLNLVYNLDSVVEGRNTIDYWTKEVRAATGQATFTCIPIGLFISYFLNDLPLRKRNMALAAVLIILFYNLTLSTRTVILLVVLVMGIGIYYSSKNTKATQISRTVMIIIALGIIAYFMYYFNVLKLRTVIEDSDLYGRFFGKDSQRMSEDTRIGYKLEFVRLMPRQLWGGGAIRRTVGSYAHDLFLDTYDEAGLVAFLAVIALIWDSAAKLRRVLRNKTILLRTRMMLVCVYAALYLLFMVEPILVGAGGVLGSFCLIHGMVSKMAHISS